MRERNACIGCSAKSRGHAGNDRTGNAGFRQLLRFLSASPEDERVSRLQPHDGLACLGASQYLRMQSIPSLSRTMASAHWQQLSLWPDKREDGLRDQLVVGHHVCGTQQFQCADSEKGRIAWSCAD